MKAKNTIVVITGPTGHQYVATVGKTATLTPVLDSAYVMSAAQAIELAQQLDLPAAPKDLDEWRVQVGRRTDVNARLEEEVTSTID